MQFSTPMMQQYAALKQAYPDCILLFRLGDFYELFMDDAKLGAQLLDITLTARPRGKDGDIPMAGVPFHSIDSYLHKLTQAGHKVAICEQTTQPDGKNLVERDVIRVITPGTVVNDTALSPKHHNYILCVYLDETNQQYSHHWAIGLADITTGTLKIADSTTTHQPLESFLSDTISTFQPKEVVVSPVTLETTKLCQKLGVLPFIFSQWDDTVSNAKKIIKKQFGSIKTDSQTSIVLKSAQSQIVAALLLEYVALMQKTAVTHITQAQPLIAKHHMQLDRSTIINLELLETLYEGKVVGSLIHTIDHTKTSMGARLLRDWILQPLTDLDEISNRHEAVEWFTKTQAALAQLRGHLSNVRDIERLTARLTLKQGSPKDCIGLAESLEALTELITTFENYRSDKKSASPKLPNLLDELFSTLDSKPLQELHQTIRKYLVVDPPFDPKQGGLINTGIHPKIDELRAIIDTNRDWMAQFEQTQKELTHIPSLKVRFNSVFGFYIEVSKSYLDKIPSEYIRRQTLVNAERFITPEMKQREDVILTAQETIQELEYELYLELLQKIGAQLRELHHVSRALAQIDCLQGFANLALAANYTKPTMSRQRVMQLEQSRHPVVETLLDSHAFVPNDISLDTKSCQVLMLTGPNMAGKSVLMRQVALITLLAQIGSFVPAKHATIGVVDHIFVRSGASDMISDGLSTFMVEMTQTALILQNVTNNSLVIMDEIGRGTSTYDGISIAWAIAEFLVDLGQARPLTLFATHYHELQELEHKYPNHIKNVHMAVSRFEDAPIFLYQMQSGAAEHSFGIDVATLAGVDAKVTARAKELLLTFEQETAQNTQLKMNTNKPKVAQKSELPTESRATSVLETLDTIALEQTTPLEALNILAKLKKIV